MIINNAAIVTPTYLEHFKYINKYLDSFYKFCKDRSSIVIYFVISREESDEFKKITSEYNEKLKIKILYIDDLMPAYGLDESAQEFLKKYGRFSFQTIKKFFALLEIPERYSLVLDSESMLVRETDFLNLFNNYFDNPFLILSDVDPIYRNDHFFNLMLENISSILKMDHVQWPIEHFMWFYDKKILLDLFEYTGSIQSMLHLLEEKNKTINDSVDSKYGIFEIVLYSLFILKFNKKYKYSLININRILREFLGDRQYNAYMNEYYHKLNGSCGIIEHAAILITNANYRTIANIFRTLNLKVIRCDFTNKENYHIQRKFMSIVNPNILASSQSHAFGINKPTDIFKQFHKDKLYKHIDRFVRPKKISLSWFFEPLSIMYHFIMSR